MARDSQGISEDRIYLFSAKRFARKCFVPLMNTLRLKPILAENVPEVLKMRDLAVIDQKEQGDLLRWRRPEVLYKIKAQAGPARAGSHL